MSIFVVRNGQAVKQKLSIIKNGVEVPLKDLYQILGGQAVKVYQSYDCQAHNYADSGSRWVVSGGIAEDGSINSNIYGAKGTWLSVFYLLFDAPLDSEFTLTVHGIYINPNNSPPGECWLEIDGITSDGATTVIGQKFIPNSPTDLVFTYSRKQFIKLIILANANAINNFNVIAPAASITVNNQQISQVQLI
jgi:hypothetical protein